MLDINFKLLYYVPHRGINMPKGVPRNKSTEHQILHRFQIARGHLDKVITMLESGEYCIDIVHQSLAVQSALKKANEAVLENHLKTCVAQEIRKGNSSEVIEEVMKVVSRDHLSWS